METVILELVIDKALQQVLNKALWMLLRTFYETFEMVQKKILENNWAKLAFLCPNWKSFSAHRTDLLPKNYLCDTLRRDNAWHFAVRIGAVRCPHNSDWATRLHYATTFANPWLTMTSGQWNPVASVIICLRSVISTIHQKSLDAKWPGGNEQVLTRLKHLSRLMDPSRVFVMN